MVGQVSFVDDARRAAFGASVRVRHRAEPIEGQLSPVDAAAGLWSVELQRPAWAPAPGQAAVFYDRDAVIGGGRIMAPPSSTAAA
jgi:tRNA-specific 2-thiouridylase